ncbi:MAG: 2,3-bisphosphoglycerate-independent phosphoglycerate mutase [Planctomycetota bacterium]
MADDLRLVSRPDREKRSGPVLLVVMDGVGLGPGDEGDAVALARTPTLDRLLAESPNLTLKAHGTAVGMPSDQDMGNSEVGHNALGCGRVFDQGAKLVDNAIRDGSIFDGATWKDCVGANALHLIGLLSDGNVHSHIDHLLAMIREAAESGVTRLFVHPLLDGRDVGETTALEYVDALESVLGEFDRTDGRRYAIASGGGRMLVTMDRYEADWSIVERGWRAHVLGDARKFADCRSAIETIREEVPGVGDQFLPAFVIADGDGTPVATIEDGDAVVFFNFRGDRAIEISRAFDDEGFDEFDRERHPDVLYAGMMEYDGDLHLPARYLVTPPAIDRTLGEYLATNGLRQLAAAETQKYGHVTYFWNGNRSGLYDPESGRFSDVAPEWTEEGGVTTARRSSDLETYVEIESDRVPFEQRPRMKAVEVTDAVLGEMRTGKYDFVRVNYANGDMVGHTGVFEAAIEAVETVDACLARLLDAIREMDGVALVTADHGNADEMYMRDRKTGGFATDEAGRRKAKTSHTLNPVPFILFDPRGETALAERDDAGLANVAATVLELLGFGAPEGYFPSLLADG